MNKISNTQSIKEIVMKPTAYTKCVIGQDWYKNKLEITFIPKLYYPDYMEVNAWIMENIDGKELNIEDVVAKIYAFLMDNYSPTALQVVDNIEDCKTHFDVTVMK